MNQEQRYRRRIKQILRDFYTKGINVYAGCDRVSDRWLLDMTDWILANSPNRTSVAWRYHQSVANQSQNVAKINLANGCMEMDLEDVLEAVNSALFDKFGLNPIELPAKECVKMLNSVIEEIWD